MGPGIGELTVALADLAVAVREQPEPYGSAALAHIAAWQERLLTADPVLGGEAIFPHPTSSIPPSPELAAMSAASVQAATAALVTATEQPLRLLLVSILLGATGLANTESLPSQSGPVPSSYPEETAETALGVALTHVWALQQALEKGLGVIPGNDPARGSVAARLIDVKHLRNWLIEAAGPERPRQDTHYDLPMITDASSLQTARISLESSLMDGLAAVVAAGQADWLPDAVAQVTQVQALGGQLPIWPGWSDS